MKLSTFKEILATKSTIAFELPNGELVPKHFHITEVGKVNKHFIDCGGMVRKENKINFQIWEANDYDHQLHPEKLLHIIELSEKTLQLEDLEIEVEYQNTTIGKYGIDYQGKNFLLTNTLTDCLAKDNCGVPEEKQKVALAELTPDAGCCTPGSGCC